MQVARHLAWPYPLLYHVGRILPHAARDAIYMVVSRNRLRWFGEEVCLVPPASATRATQRKERRGREPLDKPEEGGMKQD